MTNVKWLARVTLLEEPFDGYQNAVAYRMYDADGEPGEPLSRMLPDKNCERIDIGSATYCPQAAGIDEGRRPAAERVVNGLGR